MYRTNQHNAGRSVKRPALSTANQLNGLILGYSFKIAWGSLLVSIKIVFTIVISTILVIIFWNFTLF